jgi:membrane-associated phospholipid phosphatase
MIPILSQRHFCGIITAIILQLVLYPSDFNAQEMVTPYSLHWKKESMLIAGGTLSLGASQYLRNRMTLFTPEELESIDVEYLNELDRQATYMDFPRASHYSDYFMTTAQALPVFFLAGKKTRNHFGQIALLYGETMLINTGLTMTIKYAVRRPRPYVYQLGVEGSRVQSINAQSSFVSGHTSTVAAASFFMAKVYSDFHPDSAWKPVIWTAAAIAPAVTGYLRVRSGRHYPTDVLGGYVLGAAIGYLVPELHKSRGDKTSNLTISALPQSLHVSVVF